MFKSLTVRAIIPIAVSLTGFVVVCCILLYASMKADLTHDAELYETRMADTIRRSAHYAMLKADRDMLGNIIDNVGAQEGMEHVRIFNKKGLVMFSGNKGELNSFVDKKSAGCIGCHQGNVPLTTLGTMEKARRYANERGVDVIAITAPIYNEPACSSAACHFHDASQKVLGTLDIGVSAKHLNSTLALMRTRMILFSIMVLILSIVGVTAFLQRNIVLPLRAIKEFTSGGNRDSLSHKLTGISGELGDLAGDVQTLTIRLEKSEQQLVALRSDRPLLEKPAPGNSG
jgi:hypothetical protein